MSRRRPRDRTDYGPRLQPCAGVLETAGFRFYDEALALVRSIGEISNLIQLFAASDSDYHRWKSASDKDRKTEYQPASVRRRLEALGVNFLLNRDWYNLLCEAVAHPTPSTTPNTYNQAGLPMAAPVAQDAGILACLNELGRVLCLFLIQRKAVLVEVRPLAESLGGVMISELPNLWKR
jgi:hypothetical protein